MPPRLFAALLGLSLTSIPAWSQSPAVRVYISADMEGVDGVVHADQSSVQGPEYARARKLMLDEVNSAIDGALAGGATDILVNDAHATHRNLQIEGLRPPARLVSSSLKPNGQMEGLDSTFTAAIFIGYHARAGSQTGVLPHTGTGAIADLLVNGTRVGESGINTLYAASYGVPVVMITGDNMAVAQAQELTPNIDTVVVKDAIGTRAATFRPVVAVHEAIRSAAARAVRGAHAYRVPLVRPPFRFQVTFTTPALADIAEAIPTVTRTGPATVSYVSQNYRGGYRLLRLLYVFLGGPLELGTPSKP